MLANLANIRFHQFSNCFMCVGTTDRVIYWVLRSNTNATKLKLRAELMTRNLLYFCNDFYLRRSINISLASSSLWRIHFLRTDSSRIKCERFASSPCLLLLIYTKCFWSIIIPGFKFFVRGNVILYSTKGKGFQKFSYFTTIMYIPHVSWF
jgi:hypothetical protein